jgi:hypothetical protein
MERLLMLRLDAQACEAEAWLNGVPVARVDAARPRAVVPVHEYTLAGLNRLALVVGPRQTDAAAGRPPRAFVADGNGSAHLQILLPHAGHAIDAATARSLGHLSWAPSPGQACELPARRVEDILLPVGFARWRWLDAPAVEATPALHGQAASLLRMLAHALGEGDVEAFVSAVHLRTGELAAAYGRSTDDATRRLRAHLRALHDGGVLALAPPQAHDLRLRRLAEGRLLECLDVEGEPALRTRPDASGHSHSFPIRLATVEGRLHVLR